MPATNPTAAEITEKFKFDPRTHFIDTLNNVVSPREALTAIGTAMSVLASTEGTAILPIDIAQFIGEKLISFGRKETITSKEIVGIHALIMNGIPEDLAASHTHRLPYTSKVDFQHKSFSIIFGDNPKVSLIGSTKYVPGENGTLETVLDEVFIRIHGHPNEITRIGGAMNLNDVWGTSETRGGVNIFHAVNIEFQSVGHMWCP